MKKLIEHTDGWRWHDGNTSSIPFEKNSELYQEKLAEGYEVVELAQAEKDAHAQAQIIEHATSLVQSMLDTEAQSRGYDNINSIAKYMGYDNPFRSECEALGAWCASCWAKCYELQAGGVMPDDLLAEMPELVI